MWARIEDGIVVELCEVDPTGRFHESLVWVVANDSVKCGYKYEDGIFSEVVETEVVSTKDEIEKLRLVAYANPVTGCDRYFAEVMSLQAEGFAASSTEVKETKAKGLARKLEIQTLYPWPVE